MYFAHLIERVASQQTKPFIVSFDTVSNFPISLLTFIISVLLLTSIDIRREHGRGNIIPCKTETVFNLCRKVSNIMTKTDQLHEYI